MNQISYFVRKKCLLYLYLARLLYHDGPEAARAGHAEAVRALLASEELQENINCTTTSGRTALHLAAAEGQEEAVEALLAAGAEVDPTTTEQGYTPLHEAAHTGHARVARLLLQAGASTGSTTAEGYLPLHTAAHHGHEAVVKALLRAGADIDCLGGGGRGSTALEEALRQGHMQLAEMLLRK
eukprot:1189264-Prorocentrum_minimum.AAC.1